MSWGPFLPFRSGANLSGRLPRGRKCVRPNHRSLALEPLEQRTLLTAYNITIGGESGQDNVVEDVGVDTVGVDTVLATAHDANVVVSGIGTQPIGVSSANPRYFTDENGDPIYLAGSHTWYNIHDNAARGVTGNDADSFEDFLDFLESHGHNYTRLWVDWSYLSTPPWPWERPGPGLAGDGEPKFDLTAFDQDYFDLIKDRLTAMESRGIYASLMVFGSFIGITRDTTNVSWHDNNNINAFGVSVGSDFYNLANTALINAQKALVEKLLDETNSYNNIIYEIINEAAPQSFDWQIEMIEHGKAYEATLPKQHVWGITGGGGRPFNATMAAANSHDWWSPNQNDPIDGYYYEYDAGPAAYDTMPVILDTDHLRYQDYWEETEAALLQGIGMAWRSFLRGHPFIYMDEYTANFDGGSSSNEVNTYFDPFRDAMGHTIAYSQRVASYGDMIPSESASSSGYCLVDEGSDYIAFFPGSAGYSSVSVSAGNYGYEWFNTRTGTVVSSGTISLSEGSNDFTSPVSNAVLYLWATSGYQPPAAPSDLAAVAISTSQIDLSWIDNSTDETGFELDWSTNANMSGATTISVGAHAGTGTVSYSHTGLEDGTTYYYRVRSTIDGWNDSTNHPSSTPYPSAATPTAPLPPGTLLYENFNDGVANGWDTVSGTWQVISGEYVQTDTTTWGQRGPAYYTDSASWTDYRHSADVMADSERSGIIFRSDIGSDFYYIFRIVQASSQLQFLQVDQGTYTYLQTWDGYPTTVGQYYNVAATVDGTSATFEFEGQSVGTAILANTSGAVGLWAQDKNPKRFDNVLVTVEIVPPIAPSNVNATTVSPSQIDLSWTDNSTDETGFEIDWSTNSNMSGATTISVGAHLGTGTVNYSHTGLDDDTTYYYRVRSTIDGTIDSSNTPPGAPYPSAATLAAPLPPGTLLRETFNDGVADDWDFLWGDWSVVDGQYTEYDNTPSAEYPGDWMRGPAYYTLGNSWTDYRIEADIQCNADRMGIVFRADVPGDEWYIFRMSTQDNPDALMFSKEVAGTFSTVQTWSGYSFNIGQWYHLAATVIGDQATFELDGEVIGTGTVPRLSGTVGLWTQDPDPTTKYFDNVLVTTTAPTVYGTAGPDTITCEQVGNELRVQVNSDPVQVFDATVVTTVNLDGLGDADTVVLYDTGGTDQFEVGPTGCRLQLSTNIDVVGSNFETTYATATGTSVPGQQDSAMLYGSNGSDAFSGFESYSTMTTGVGVSYAVFGFGAVEADVTGLIGAAYGAASGGTDAAYLYDGTNNDVFHSGPSKSELAYFSGISVAGTGFAQVYCDGTGGGANTAYFYGSSGVDTYLAFETQSSMSGSGFYNVALGTSFSTVVTDVTGTTGGAYGSASGGPDSAYMYDSSGADTFNAGPTRAKLDYAIGNTNDATGFRYAYAATWMGHDGSLDTAHLYGSSGSDSYVAFEAYSAMSDGSSYYNVPLGFGTVTADVTGTTGGAYGSASGGTDSAYLYDSSGADTFYAGPTSARLEYASGATNDIAGFRNQYCAVYLHDGGLDTAYLYGSNSVDVYLAFEDYSSMGGVTYYSVALGFGAVYGDVTGTVGGAYGAAAGGTDYAYLYDSSGSDTYYAGPSKAEMVYASGITSEVSGVDEAWGVVLDTGVDMAYLYGSSTDDLFVADSTIAWMTNGSYYNVASGFDYVEADVTGTTGAAYGSASGGTDTAFLYDSALNDLYYAEDDEATMDYNYDFDAFVEILARGFDPVWAVSTNGGTDETDESTVNPPTFTTTYDGPW